MRELSIVGDQSISSIGDLHNFLHHNTLIIQRFQYFTWFVKYERPVTVRSILCFPQCVRNGIHTHTTQDMRQFIPQPDRHEGKKSEKHARTRAHTIALQGNLGEKTTPDGSDNRRKVGRVFRYRDLKVLIHLVKELPTVRLPRFIIYMSPYLFFSFSHHIFI